MAQANSEYSRLILVFKINCFLYFQVVTLDMKAPSNSSHSWEAISYLHCSHWAVAQSDPECCADPENFLASNITLLD